MYNDYMVIGLGRITYAGQHYEKEEDVRKEFDLIVKTLQERYPGKVLMGVDSIRCNGMVYTISKADTSAIQAVNVAQASRAYSVLRHTNEKNQRNYLTKSIDALRGVQKMTFSELLQKSYLMYPYTDDLEIEVDIATQELPSLVIPSTVPLLKDAAFEAYRKELFDLEVEVEMCHGYLYVMVELEDGDHSLLDEMTQFLYDVAGYCTESEWAERFNEDPYGDEE